MSKKCVICGIDLKGWIYYEKNNFCICKFCYEGLELRGDEE